MGINSSQTIKSDRNRTRILEAIKNLPDSRRAMRHYMSILFVLATMSNQVIEIGVCSGQSTLAFLLGLLESGGKLWSCDINPPEYPASELLDLENWEFVLGDSKEVIHQSPCQADVLLVDGAFEDRLNDLIIYGDRVRSGGIILAHDISQVEVGKQIGEFLNNNRYFMLNSYDASKGMVVIGVK